jgi:hypothetical protein
MTETAPVFLNLAGHRIRLAVGLSLLAHVLALVIPVREWVAGEAAPASGSSLPLTVLLALPDTADSAAVAAVPEPPAPKSAPVPRPRREPQLREREVAIARATPAPEAAPFRVPEPAAPPAPSFDMAALIQANRERRRAAEAGMQRGIRREPAPTDSAVANLNRNLESLSRSDGTGGVFHVTRVGGRTAEFAFNGWNPKGRGRWREMIEVEAGPDGDVERAVVRRMIALIREHYSGDFSWESHRLGRVLVLSAAPEDNAGLEEFLLREFFGTPLVRRGP